MNNDYQSDGVRAERTNFRDQQISNRHRKYGFDSPAVDLDFILVEYDQRKACALIEHKCFTAARKAVHPNNPAFQPMTGLADNSKIPSLLAIYWPEFWGYWVYPLNDVAMKYITGWTDFTEREYVELLYKIRNRIVPKKVYIGLNHRKPPRKSVREVQ